MSDVAENKERLLLGVKAAIRVIEENPEGDGLDDFRLRCLQELEMQVLAADAQALWDWPNCDIQSEQLNTYLEDVERTRLEDAEADAE